ncbi:MAG: hypothetical protein HGA80_06425 [Candidatus Omnitrophica bacterium]|nr:hypothetical protein [Candidatus Omnitrophota bacterium]
MQGGKPQKFLTLPDRTNILDIPQPFDSRLSFKGVRLDHPSPNRSRFILETASRIRPDIFLTEFFPLGRLEYLSELLPVIRLLKKQGTRIFASIGYPYLVDLPGRHRAHLASLVPAIIKLYDRILIHTPPGLENTYLHDALKSGQLRRVYDNFFSRIAHKTTYTGYVVPHAAQPSPAIRKLMDTAAGTFTIVVSRGGGAVCPQIITRSILAQKILGNCYRFIIAAGPATTPAEKALFLSCLKKTGSKNVFLFDYLPELAYCLQHCSASVSMSGYNTAVQLLSFGTPSIIIPYASATSHEAPNDQLARAALLKDHLDSTVLGYDTLSPQILAHSIQEKCERPRPARPRKSWFTGKRATSRILLQEEGRDAQ